MMLFKLFFIFFKIGLFTFGGGYAMLPLIQREIINNGWLTIDQLINFIAVSESTPGPFAVNISTYIGTIKGGFWGAIASTFGVVLPSFIIILFIANKYESFKESKYIKYVMFGLKSCVVGLISSTLYTMFGNVFDFSNMRSFSSLIILIISLTLLYKKKHPIAIIIGSGLLGIFIGSIC